MGFIKKFLSVLLAHYSVFQNDFTQWNWRTNVYKDFFLCCSLWMWISVVFSFVFGVKCVCIIHVALELELLCLLFFDSHGCVALREQKESDDTAESQSWGAELLLSWVQPHIWVSFLYIFSLVMTFPSQKTKQGLICWPISWFITFQIRLSYIMVKNTSMPLQKAI